MVLEIFSIAMDIIILSGLAAFIFFALKLSRALNSFRSHRDEFDGIMRQLNEQIEQAQLAVKSLSDTSDTSNAHLTALVNEGRELAEELQLMNQSGNSLASRLETLADRSRDNTNRGAVRGSGSAGGRDYADNVRSMSERIKGEKPRSAPQEKNDDGFVIQDTDFDDELGGVDDLDQTDGADEGLNKLSSQAEKELYKALMKNKKAR